MKNELKIIGKVSKMKTNEHGRFLRILGNKSFIINISQSVSRMFDGDYSFGEGDDVEVIIKVVGVDQ